MWPLQQPQKEAKSSKGEQPGEKTIIHGIIVRQIFGI